MVGYHQEPDEDILSLRTKRVTRRGCCQDPYPDPHGKCMSCGGPYKAGQEAYEVTLELPNGVSLRDPSVQEHLSQVVPPEWPGFTTVLESSDRDSSKDNNKYKIVLYRRQQVPEKVMPAIVNSKFVLPHLIRLADRLDQVREFKYATAIDSMIKSITKADTGANK